MGLLDRFRAQPKWKHADAAVRLAGVEEIPLEDQGLLATLARGDNDARVRRAAVRKVYDPVVLKEVNGRDADAEVREEASGVLLDLAIGAFEDSTEGESLKALEHLEDPKHLAAVAKGATSETVSLAALARLTDGKAISSVARRSQHASTRLEALARVDAADEILAIAMRTDHRDVGLGAVERVSDREHLGALAARASQKQVARRARALLRKIEEAEAATRAAEAAAAETAPVAPDWSAERDKVCREMEEAAGGRDWRAGEARVATLVARWEQIERDEHASADPDRTSRFAAACERARQAVARGRDDEAARAEHAERAARQRAERVAVCERVEALTAAIGRRAAAGAAAAGETAGLEDIPAQLESARQAWAALQTPLLSPEDLERLEQRFDRASSACRREAERTRDFEARRGRLAELAQQAEAFAAAGSVDRTLWAAVRQEWADLGGARAAGDALAARFEAAQSTIVRRETEAREQEQQRQRETLTGTQQACERLDAVAKAETLTLKDGERALRDLRAALDGVGSLPRKDRAELGDRLRAIQSALFPRVQELRESDEWVRWANVGIQEDLCRQAEALRDVPEAGEAARKLRELQQQWKQASVAPRDRARELWERFKRAGDDVHARAETQFAQQATERAGNLARKEALCQQAEALAESTDWIRTAEAIKQLQTEWKAIGPVSRGHEKAIWERFRAACDRFFTRRREDLTHRKEEWAANLARKEALIARAEALAGTTGEWERTIDEIKRLQAEWKAVGPVRRNRSEEVWQRFRGACDRCFERYQQRDHLQVEANVAAREAICQEMEAVVPSGDAAAGGAPDDLAVRVSALRGRWQQAPTLMPRDTLAALTVRFNTALGRAASAFPDAFRGTELDPEAVRRKAEDLCARVERLLPSEPASPPAVSPAEVLAARLREALAANTIGGVAVAEAESKWKTTGGAVRDAQAAWAALGPLAAEAAAPFADRFERACRRALEAAEKHKR